MEIVICAVIVLAICREVAHWQHVRDLREAVNRHDKALDLFNKATIAIRAIELGKEYEPVAHNVMRSINKPLPLGPDPVANAPEEPMPSEAAEFTNEEYA